LSGLWKKKQLDEPLQLIPRAATHEEARAVKARMDREKCMLKGVCLVWLKSNGKLVEFAGCTMSEMFPRKRTRL